MCYVDAHHDSVYPPLAPPLPCCPRRSTKADPDGDEPADGTKEESEESGEEEGERGEENTLLMNFRHRFEATLREANRMLTVKDLMISFEPSSIYGNRAGFLKGLLVTVPKLAPNMFLTLSFPRSSP